MWAYIDFPGFLIEDYNYTINRIHAKNCTHGGSSLSGRAGYHVNFTLLNSTFENINGTDFNLKYASVTLINTTFNQSSVSFGEDSNLTVKWYFDIQVLDRNHFPIEGAEIYIRNATLNRTFLGLSDKNGRLAFILPQFYQNMSGILDYSNYTISVARNAHLMNLTHHLNSSVTLPICLNMDYGIEVKHSFPEDVILDAGETEFFTFNITNHLSSAENLSLEVSPGIGREILLSGNGLTIKGKNYTTSLYPGEKREFTVILTMSDEAPKGTTVSSKIGIIPEDFPDVVIEQILNSTCVHHEVELVFRNDDTVMNLSMYPGERLRVPVTVENKGNMAENLLGMIEAPENGWIKFPSIFPMTISSAESFSFNLTIEMPDETVSGDGINSTMMALLSDRYSSPIFLNIDILPESRDLELIDSGASSNIHTGNTTYTLIIRNTGLVQDTFRIVNNSTLPLHIQTDVVILAVGEERRINVTLEGRGPYDSSSLRVMAYSITDPAVKEEMVLNRPPYGRIQILNNETDFYYNSLVMFNVFEIDDEDPDHLIFSWDFGDGKPLTQAMNPAHAFERAGYFTIHLIIEDSSGLMSDDWREVIIKNIPPEIHYSVEPENRTAEMGKPVILDASDSTDRDGEIIEYRWVVNEKETYYGPRINHTFPTDTTAGIYHILLYLKDNLGAVRSADIELNITNASVGKTTPGNPQESKGPDAEGYILTGAVFLLAGLVLGHVVFHVLSEKKRSYTHLRTDLSVSKDEKMTHEKNVESERTQVSMKEDEHPEHEEKIEENQEKPRNGNGVRESENCCELPPLERGGVASDLGTE
ncbi:MAG: hypothetical protein KAU14_05510 [Thermoplasmata archaeon]|nr:hypothetical protein [Thermoplasmata archaeon]